MKAGIIHNSDVFGVKDWEYRMFAPVVMTSACDSRLNRLSFMPLNKVVISIVLVLF